VRELLLVHVTEHVHGQCVGLVEGIAVLNGVEVLGKDAESVEEVSLAGVVAAVLGSEFHEFFLNVLETALVSLGSSEKGDDCEG